MQGYTSSSYGDGFADVYDEWYHDVSDVHATVDALHHLAGTGPVLELGVGTGRLALPLARTGLVIHGIDTSAAMLDRLGERDPGQAVTTHHGDMVDDLPPGPFTVVFVAYNTLFNLTDPARQAACFAAVAERLTPGGRFVVEAFVPEDPPPQGHDVGVRSMSADRVVLTISVHHPDEQVAEGQFVEFSEHDGIRLRPWMIRYSTPAELDAMATATGLELEHRWTAFGHTDFDEHSDRHVSVYRLASQPAT